MKNLYKIFIYLLITCLIGSCTFDDKKEKSPTEPTDDRIPHEPNPDNGSINQDNLILLSWKSIGAESYTVYLDTKNPPERIEKENLKTNSILVFVSGSSKTYYWKIIPFFSDGSFIDGPVWSFTTTDQGSTPLGYAILMHSLLTEPPNKVKVLFQVLDLNNKGVDLLQLDDFEIFEDGEKVSPTESKLRISKRQDNDYTFKTVLMLDNSTSITDDSININNLQLIKDAANSFVDNMLDQQKIAVYQFSSSADLLIDFTSSSNSFVIKNAINGISKGASSTDLYGSIIEGTSKLEEKFSSLSIVQSAMVLFTDGDDTQGSHSLSQALDAIIGKLVYAVGLGAEIEPEVLELLSNGTFFKIEEVGQLNQIFFQIQQEIELLANSFYWMEYESPKRGNSDHLFQLRIKDNLINSFLEGTFSSAGFFDATPDIYFNTSFVNPSGISEVTLIAGGDPVEVRVSTYGGENEPRYAWANSDLLIREVKDPPKQSILFFSAVDTVSSDTTITLLVSDVMNRFSKSINFNIFTP
ncbi:VWA domain-containing protein [Bacteroidota bacterium]